MQNKRLPLALCLVIVFALHAIVSGAQNGVRILENRHAALFAEKITFDLVAEGDEAIEGVTLYYRRQNEAVTSRVVPEFTPGRHVEARYEKTLERGEIPPGTVMEYYWRLDLASGTRSETETVTFVYEDDRFAWQVLEAGRVTILYYGDDSTAALGKELAERGKSTLARLQSEVGVTLEAPVRVYVYGDADDMVAALAPRSQGFDERILTLGVAVSDDTLLLLGDHPAVRQTLAHELSHVVVGLATENPYAPVPRWLDEGLAMYTEGELPVDNAVALKRAVTRDALISVRSLSGYTGDASQVDLYYGEVHSLVGFLLRTYGRDKMGELLQVFKQGTYQEDAVQQVYGLSLDELDARWRQSLGLGPRATPAPADEPVPQTRRGQPSRQPCPSLSLIAGLGLAAALGARRVRLC